MPKSSQPPANVPLTIVQGKIVVERYPTPNLSDRVYVRRMDARVEKNKIPPAVGSVYDGPDPVQLEGFVFATAKPADQGGFVDWYYLNERANQDAYNFAVDYPYGDKTYPRITRTYVLLRDGLVEPQVNTVDPIFAGLQLTDHKQLRIDGDPVLDSLLVVVQRVYEILPGPIITTVQENQFQQLVTVDEQELAAGTVATPSATTEIAKADRTGTAKLKVTKGDTDIVFSQLELSVDRNESVIPYVFQALLPRYKTSQVVAGTVAPPVLGAGDWSASEKQLTLYKKLVERITRGFTGFAKLVGYLLTRDQQVATVTQTWTQGPQFITPRATLIDAEVDNWGEAGTFKKEVEVQRVFPEGQFSIEVADPIPPEFQYLSPTTVVEITSPGIAVLAPLGPGEVQHTETQKTDFIKRVRVVGHDLGLLPRTLVDQELTEAFGFGGKANVTRTIDTVPQQVDEGIFVIDSKVKHLPGGLTLKETTAIAADGGHIDITNQGTGYTSPPTISFSGGGAAGGGAATASVQPSSTSTDAPIGGTFTLALTTPGDTNGVFYLLGQRANGGTWRNPLTSTDPMLFNWDRVDSLNPQFSNHYDNAQLAALTDQSTAATPTSVALYDAGVDSYGDSYTNGQLVIDLGPGRTVAPTGMTIRRDTSFNPDVDAVRITGSNDGITYDLLNASNMANNAAGDWNTFSLPNTTAYRYFKVRRTTGSSNVGRNTFRISEIELYGELVITPVHVCEFSYNGDAGGAFYYLGAQGNSGVWRNPFTNGNINITAPYDTLEFGTFDSMVDRQPSNTYFVQRAGAEVWFDLTAGHALFLTHFSFRQRANYGSPMREVDIQGSNDGVTWGYSYTAPCSGDASAWTTVDVRGLAIAGERYRYFRIILHPPNSFLAVGEFELYGTLVLPAPVDGGLVLSEINVTNGGDYVTAPTVVITGGGGSGASAVAILDDHAVSKVVIASRGTGFTSAPSISFTGGVSGTAATAHAVIGKAVASVAVTNGGTGYTYPPTVIFGPVISADGIEGGGAVGVAVLSNGLSSINVTNPGSGYTSTPGVTFTGGGGGTGAAATAVRGFPVASVAVTNGGTGFTTPPQVLLTGDGQGAAAHAVLGVGVRSINMIDDGAGYTSDVVVVITPVGSGSGASATATRSLSVASVAVTDGGDLFTSPPTVGFTGGGGTGAVGVAKLEVALGAVTLTKPGSGYTSDPAITFSGGGGGTGAAATATRNLTVASATVGTGGTGYTAPLSVVFDPPVGSGTTATGTASLGLASAAVTTAGTGYVVNDVLTLVGGTFTTAGQLLVTAVDGGGVISTVSVQTVGGYSALPTSPVAVTGGTGTGANFTPDWLVAALAITGGGSGYTAAPGIALSGGTGTGAAATAVLDAAGPLKAITVTAAGSGYISKPVVVIDTGAGGTGAAATIAISNTDHVAQVSITNGGRGYTSAPDIGFTGGGGGVAAVAAATLSTTGPIGFVKVTAAGSGYDALPDISFTSTGGSGATAVATAGTATGAITAIVLDFPGSGYTSAPTVSIAGGTSAAGTATLGSTGIIKRIALTTAGTGYTSAPTVVIAADAGGTLAAATAVLGGGGVVKSVTITHGGSAYTAIPTVTFLPGGSGGTGAVGAAVLATSGTVVAAILDTPGDYRTPPTVIFTGGGGTGAAGVYVPGEGWPKLYETITDAETGVVVKVTKEIVPAGTRYPGEGFVEIRALDKWRSVLIVSKLDESSLPAPEIFNTWTNYRFPPELISIIGAWSTGSTGGTSGTPNYPNQTPIIGSTKSSSSSVHGTSIVNIKDGYQGPCLTEVTRTYMKGPPSCHNTPKPLFIQTSSGSVVASGSESSQTTQLKLLSQTVGYGDVNGISGGGYATSLTNNTADVPIDNKQSTNLSVEHISGVLTGNFSVLNAAVTGGYLTVSVMPSTPLNFTPGQVFVSDVRVTKMRFNIWMVDVVRITVPPSDGVCDISAPPLLLDDLWVTIGGPGGSI